MLTLLFVFAAVFLSLVFYNFFYKRRGLPPGPTPWPLVGNLLALARRPPGERCFLEWRQRFGSVYTFWMAELPVVCVAGHEKILELFQRDGDSYADRLNFPEIDALTKEGVGGIFETNGDLWREHRRFTMQVFRELGVGRNVMQERILEEFQAMAERIDKLHEKNVSEEDLELDLGKDFIDPAVGSIINAILFGYRFDEDTFIEFYRLKGIVRSFLELVTDFRVLLLIFWPHTFKRLPVFRGLFAQYSEKLSSIYAFFRDQIKAHKAEIDFGDLESSPKDYVEAFLKHQHKLDRDGVGDHTFTDEQLRAMCFDLWIAGQETSSATLAWGIAFLLHNPRVMEGVHAELDEAIGRGDPHRLVTLDDRPNLPFLGAVINEIQRCTNILPANAVRRTTREVEIDGYRLPKGTAIVPQISAVLIDPEAFPDPLEFCPERFIDDENDDGKMKLKRCDALMPFGVGKRQCAGESLARYELFLFLGNILKRYELIPGRELPSLERKLAFTVPAPKIRCGLRKRF